MREAVEEHCACGSLRLSEIDKLADAAVLLVNNAARLPGGLDKGTENYLIIEDLIRAAVRRGGQGDTRLAYAIGRLRYVDLDWPTAWAMLKEAYAEGEGHDPERTRRWFYRATVNRSDLLIKAFRVDEAVAELTAVIADSPPDADWMLAAKLNLAAAHRRLEERVESERILTELTQEFPDSPQPWNSLGQVLFDQGRLEESLAAYERSISLAAASGAPFGDTIVSMAHVLYKLGRAEDSERMVQRFLETSRDAPQGLYLLAHLLRDKGDTAEAVRVLRRATRIAENDHQMLTLLQQIHYERDEIAEAEAVQRRIDALIKAARERLEGGGDDDGDTGGSAAPGGSEAPAADDAAGRR